MTDFFISYTGADQTWAEWIGWVLEKADYSVTLQAWDFLPGASFVVEMHEAAQKCERTVVVLSPAYLSSHFGTMEWATALAQKKQLLPVRILEVEPTGLLAGIIYIDLVGLDVGTARSALLAGAQGERAKPPAEPSYPAHTIPRLPLDVGSLPEEKIPEPGPLPEGSRMPFAVNPLFVGREDDLRTLARQLKAHQTSAIGQVEIAGVTGLGGIGKTQLASEFVHRYGRYFEGGVFWMSFAEPAAVPAEVAACGRSLDLHPSYESLPLDQQVRLVEEEWQRPVARLLVFDNCEDESLLDRWRPRFGGARVLVTSRRPRWDRALGVRAVPITTLPRAASIELLRRFRQDVPATDPVLMEIAAELGDLPLALHLAGSSLERYAQASFGQPGAYLASLRQGNLLDHPSLQGKFSGMSPTKHEIHVGRTFALSVEQLEPGDATDELARSLLARAAYFAPGESIPREFLLKTVPLEGDEARYKAEDALSRLVALGLLEQGEGGALILHRLVGELARELGAGDEARDAVEETVFVEVSRLNKAGLPAALLRWQPHLRAVTDRAKDREDTRAAELCSELDYYLGMIGDFAGARLYSERALAIWEKALGPEHPDTALSLNNLGFLLRSQGDLAGARPYYERALAIREKVLRLEHPDTAQSLNNLGALLRNQGDFAGARPYFERALAIKEKVLGPEHPDTALSLNNLGVLLQSQGNLAGARPCYERALAIRDKVLGPEHPDTAQSLNNLGGLLQSQGDLAGARPYYERALAIFEVRLGQDHPNTKIVRNNLAALCSPPGGETPDTPESQG